MAINFPTSLDNFTNPTSANTLDSPSHSVQHSDINDAVEAIEAKIGVGSSTAGSATAGYALVNTSGGTTAYSLLGVSGLSSGTAPIDTFLRADGAGGAAFASVSTAQGSTLLVPSSVSVGGTAATGSVSATGTITFGTATSVSINDVFSATYTSYRILVTYTSASGAPTRLRWRVAGADNTSTNYKYTGFRSNIDDSTTGSWTQTVDGNDFHFMGETTSGGVSSSVIDVFQPFATAKTNYIFSAVRETQYYAGAGYFNATTSFPSFTIYAVTGNMTGSVSVFGYAK
jgi:hypothetical protein